jgi:hypothetical protein
MGEGNVISRVTVRRFGGGGIVTSQLSNVVEYAHVYGGTTIGEWLAPCVARRHY